MDQLPLVLAFLALLLALAAWRRAGGATRRADEAARDAQRHAANAAQELETNVANLRTVVGAMAAGESLTREMVLEGQLWRDVTPQEGQDLVESQSVRLIDVRTPQETAMGIIPGAVLIPIDELETRLRDVPKDGAPTLLYCAGGGRSAAACEFLSGKGYSNLMNLTGGFGSWGGARAKPS